MKANEVERLGSGVKLSLIAHSVLLSIMIIKSLVFPSDPTPYSPTLRVDVVDLPDIMKKDLHNIGALPPLPEPPKEKESAPKEKAEPEEMAMKRAEKPDAKRKDKMSNAIARIKALNKIKEGEEEAKVIKGNQVSKGLALGGDAKERAEPSYYDLVHQKIKENWELPIWLARQELRAQVLIRIDSRGNLRNFAFVQTSGNAQFDAAVKQAVQKSSPFDPPPAQAAANVFVDGIQLGFPL